jgi:hypothetical protein
MAVVSTSFSFSQQKEYSLPLTVSTPFDCTSWGVFANSAEMSRFIREDLGNIPGVITRETVSILRVVKVF